MPVTAVLPLFVQVKVGTVTVAETDVTVDGSVMYPANGYREALARVVAVVAAPARSAARLVTSRAPTMTAVAQPRVGERVAVTTEARSRCECLLLLVHGVNSLQATSVGLPSVPPRG